MFKSVLQHFSCAETNHDAMNCTEMTCTEPLQGTMSPGNDLRDMSSYPSYYCLYGLSNLSSCSSVI